MSPDCVCGSGESWAAGGDVAVAGARGVWTDPERVERAICDVESESDGTIGERGHVGCGRPGHACARAVAADRDARRSRVWRDRFSVRVEELDSQLACRRGHVDEQMFSAEADRPRDERSGQQRGDAFDAIFARVWVKEDTPPPQTGLWWCRAKTPSSRLSDWGQPIQIMTAEDRGWHSGPWKPSLQFHEQIGERALIFFDGSYRTSDPGPFLFAFTLGCLELDLPVGSVFSAQDRST